MDEAEKAAIDVDFVARLIESCAETHVMPRFRALAAHEIRSKSGPDDLVTQADLDMERALEQALTQAYPGTRVLGEEGMAAGTVSLDLLDDPDLGVWVVDPVDGTYNFVHGHTRFGTLVAFVRGGRTLAGWIYDAPRRAATVARKGLGVSRPGATFALSRVERAREARGGLGLHYFPEPVRAIIRGRLDSVGAHACMNCAAHEYLDFIEGRIDFAIHTRANPWDHLAGALAVEELGGVVRTWSGGRYDPARPESLLIAANEALWDDVHRALLEGVDFP